MRTTFKKKREYFGESRAAFLVEWLNGHEKEHPQTWARQMSRRYGSFSTGRADKEARVRVVGLLSDLADASRLTELLCLKQNTDEARGGFKRLQQLSERINDTLQHFDSHPVVHCNEPGWKSGRWQRIYGNTDALLIWGRS